MAPRTGRAAPSKAPGFQGFDPGILRFLAALKRHNRREWFEAHRHEYETFVRDGMREFVEEMDVRLARLTPELVGDPRKSLFRIHRDVRFSRDKSPYKTHTACWFFHRDAGRGVGSEAHGGAGFYVHVEPGASMVGGGLWMPPRPALTLLRDALAEAHRPFVKIVTAPAFKRRFGGLDGEARLTRVPRGYPPDHPAAEWLRYTSFTAGRMLTDREILDPRLATRLETDIARMTPLIRWLNAALGFPPASRRL